MSESAGRAQVRGARRIVVKVGSALLAQSGTRFIGRLAGEMTRLMNDGREMVLVSSGAIALGFRALGLDKRPTRVDELQAAAAIGQPELMRRWSVAFSRRGRAVAQVLLTHADLASRERFLNARHALAELLRAGVVAIANENDTVATDEIKVGDNDRLSAQIASLVGADLLVLLTTADGVYSADPERDAGALRIPLVHRALEVSELAGGAGKSGVGTGGMRTKIIAAESAQSRGVAVVIAHGGKPRALERVLAGEDVGTLFLPNDPLSGRKHWIGYTLKPQGRLNIDGGAARAVRQAKKSLLPSGLVAVDGEFERGAMVEVVGPEGLVARGLSAYGASELRQLIGAKTTDIARRLGYVASPEIVHRDDMVVLEPAASG